MVGGTTKRRPPTAPTTLVASRSRRAWQRLFGIAFALTLLCISAANAQVVTSSTDDGTGQPGTLSAAINFANANPGSTITFSGVTTVTLSASLPAITASTTIDGGSTVTIQAAGNQPFTINSGTVLLENMSVSGAKVLGEAGGTGNGGGGGGLAGGGAIYADAGSALTIKNVNFSNNQAIGGAGGHGDGTSANGGNGGATNINSHGVLSGTGGEAGGPGNGASTPGIGAGAGSGASGTTGGAGNGGGNGGAKGVGGNGGNGLGGAVFVSNGTMTTIAGGTTIDATNTATAGAGGTGTTANGTAGGSGGGGLYVGINSTATFDTSTTNTTVSGNILNNGFIVLSGGGNGTVFFTGTNNLSSGATPPGPNVTVNSGTLNGNTNSLNGDIIDNSAVVFNQNFAGVYSNVLSGTGSVTASGGGEIVFTGANSYSGGTTIATNTVLLGNTTSLQGNMTNSGALIFDQNTAGTYGGNINGVGSVGIEGGGAVTFSGVNTYTGGTTVAGGTTLIGTTANVQGTVVNGGLVTFSQAFNGAYNGNMSGNGQVSLMGGGDITFDATNSYTGGTTVASGTTLTGNTSGVQGAIVNNGIVTFNQTTSGQYTGSMSGTGSVNLAGTGNILFSGTNSYSGGTTVAAGTLTGTTSSVQGAITNDSHVVFDQSTTGSYTGVMTGTGDVTKNGSGAVTFTAANNYIGPTTVNAGQLSINGSITSNTTVASGGSLGGTGTITGNVINSGSITQTGATGTLHVTGDLTSNSSATTNVRVTGAGHTAGVDNDLVAVGGNVTLGGQVAAKLGSNNDVGTYTFLTYGGTRTGSFSGITTSGAALSASLVYVAGAVEFTTTRNFANVALTPNQSQVANYLDQNQGNPSADFQTVLTQLGTLSSSGIRSALQQMEGEVFGTTAQLGIQSTTYLYILLRRTAGAKMLDDPYSNYAPAEVDESVPLADDNPDEKEIVLVSFDEATGKPVICRQCVCCPQWTGTVSGYGLGGYAGSDGNASNGTYGLGGTLVTLERQLDQHHVFGLFGAYSSLSLRLGDPSQTNRDNDGQFGTYFRRDDGFNYWLAAGSIGFDGYNSSRSINFGTINRTAKASYGGWQATSYLERGVRFPLAGGCYLEPFEAMQYIYLRQNAFTETGAGSLDLSTGGFNNNALRNLLGARIVNPYRFGWWRPNKAGGRINSELRALWLHEYLAPESGLNSRFASIGGASFATQGLNFGRDWAVMGGGVSWEMSQFSSIALYYDMQLNSRQTFQVGSASFRLSF